MYIRSVSRALDGSYDGPAQRTGMKNKVQVVNRRFTKRYSRQRTVKFSILAANALLLAAVLLFVLQSSRTTQTTNHTTTQISNAIVDPLDQLSSADVAVNVARLANLHEATSVANHADTVNALLSVNPSDQTVVAKPAIVATDFKSNKDIQLYVTKAGDTVGKLAKRFNVTSDSIINSNGLNSNNLRAGLKLYIPPVNGIVYVVKKGDTPHSLANKFNANAQQIIAYNDAEIRGIKVGERIIIPNGVVAIVAAPASTLFSTFGGNFTASFGSNGYDFGWCTWYVANRRAQLGRPVPSNLGDAYSWFILAQRAGLPTGYTPRVGAVAVNQGGNHVSVVERVNSDGSFIVSEMNSRGYDSINTIGMAGHEAGGWDRVDYKMYQSIGPLAFIY